MRDWNRSRILWIVVCIVTLCIAALCGLMCSVDWSSIILDVAPNVLLVHLTTCIALCVSVFRNDNNGRRCFRDLSEEHMIGWVAGDVITVMLNLDKWRIKFRLNGKTVKKTMSLQPKRTYFPVISCVGNCQYRLMPDWKLTVTMIARRHQLFILSALSVVVWAYHLIIFLFLFSDHVWMWMWPPCATYGSDISCVVSVCVDCVHLYIINIKPIEFAHLCLILATPHTRGFKSHGRHVQTAVCACARSCKGPTWIHKL